MVTCLFNLQDITRDNLRSLQFNQFAISTDHSLEGQCLLKLIDNRASLKLLYETDRGIKYKEGANNTEVDPILKTRSKNCSSLWESTRISVFHKEARRGSDPCGRTI